MLHNSSLATKTFGETFLLTGGATHMAVICVNLSSGLKISKDEMGLN